MRSLLFFLLAFEPYGRQFCCKSTFVASLTGSCCWWRGDGEAFIPSGLSPAVKILVRCCSSIEDGPDCFLHPLSRFFLVNFWGLGVIFWVTCTEMLNE
jgi:hypothetical protein